MKHLKFYVSALLALVFVPNLHAAADAMAPGQVKALIVVGDVQLVDSMNNHKPLSKGETFTEGNTVIAGPNSGATLVLSNGATVRVKENGQLNITKFEQAPFDSTKTGDFIRLTADPSKSITELDLRNGTLQGEVKKLDTAEGSTFNVHTPAGSAGIRGTVISISVVRDSNGVVIGITANCSVGTMAFTPAPTVSTTATGTGGTTQTITNSNVSVDAGSTIQISLTPTAGGGLSATVSGANVSSAQIQAQVTELYAAINAIRAADPSGPLPPVTPPTVSASTAPVTVTSATGTTTSVPLTVPISDLTPPTAPIQNVIPPSPPANPAGNNTPATTGPATSASTGTGAATGTGAPNPNTNPSVSPQ